MMSPLADKTPKISATPAFESLKSNAVISGNLNSEFNSPIEQSKRPDVNQQPISSISSAQQRAELADLAQRLKQKQIDKNVDKNKQPPEMGQPEQNQNTDAEMLDKWQEMDSILLRSAEPLQKREEEHFYSVKGQDALFSSSMKQRSSTNLQQISQRIPVIEQIQEDKNEIHKKCNKTFQTDSEPSQEQRHQEESLTSNLKREDTQTICQVEEQSAIRQTSLYSNIVWQASQDLPDMASTARDALNIVNEEDLQPGKNQLPLIEIQSRKSSITESQSVAKNSRTGSVKKVASKKKKKKSLILPKAQNVSNTHRNPLPPTLTNKKIQRAGSGLISPNTPRAESFTAPATKTTGVSSNKPTSAAKMTLKSNTALTADLQKQLTPKNSWFAPPKPAKKKTTSQSKDKLLKQPKKEIPKLQISAIAPSKDEEQKKLELETPKNITQQDLEALDPPENTAQSVQQTPSQNQDPNTGPQIVLVSSCKPVKKRQKVVEPGETASHEDLKIEIKRSKSQLPNGTSVLEQTPNLTKSQNSLLFGEFDISPGTQSFAHASHESFKLVKNAPPHRQNTTRNRTNKDKKTKESRNDSFAQNNSQCSPQKSARELQVLEIPPEYDPDSSSVVEYMLGEKAVEIETPLFQVNIQSKLVYTLSQLNGDEPPPFIKVVENKLGRKVIKIRQKETTGVQQLYQLNLEVRNPETNIMANYKCRVFVRPGIQLQLRKPLFESPIEYSIKGPPRILQMPVYSAKHDDLDFYLEAQTIQGDEEHVTDLPSFIRISRDSHGNRVIKCYGNLTEEIGAYNLKLIARDKVTHVINDQFKFQIIGTQGIEVAHLPKEYENEIKVDPTQTLIQLAMPTFNLETVKEEALPLEYSLVMHDGSSVPECIQIKSLEDGDYIIELKAAELPDGCPGGSSVFEVQLKVFDPNADATQLIPISVKCPEPNLMLLIKETNFPEEVRYNVGSKELQIPVPQYFRNDEKPILEPVLLTIGGKDCAILNRISQLCSDEAGAQTIRVHTTDPKLQGVYDVKVYATEQSSGLTNQDAVFKLHICESVLTLTETPNVCFLGKSLSYEPKGAPQYIPLPSYGISRAQLEFKLESEDPHTPVPNFARIQGDYLLIEGAQNPTAQDYNLLLKVHDPISGTNDQIALHITSNIYEIILERVPFNSPVMFNLGDEIMLPMPEYRQEPYKRELTYEIEIEGVGMMLGGLQLASVVQQGNDEFGRGQSFIKIAGGENTHKGSYRVCVIASEKSLGVVNREVIFILEAKPQLKMLKKPEEFDLAKPMQVDQVYRLPMPTYATKNRLRYQVYQKGTDFDQNCPDFITLKCPKQAQPYIEIKCNAQNMPTQQKYDLEFIASDNQEHNVENVQNFSLCFDLQPRISLVSFDVECPIKYTIGQGELKVDLPIYSCYIAEISQLDIKLISEYNDRVVAFAFVDRDTNSIVIKTQNDGFEGLHDVKVVVEMPEFNRPRSSSSLKAIANNEAKFRVEIMNQTESATEKGMTAVNSTNIIPVAERSSETLPLHDNRSEELQGIYTGLYQNQDQQHHNEIGDGDRISLIEEDEGEIPIYYSDQSNDKLPLTPIDAQNVRRPRNAPNTNRQPIAGSSSSKANHSDLYEQRRAFEINIQSINDAQHSNSTDNELVVVQATQEGQSGKLIDNLQKKNAQKRRKSNRGDQDTRQPLDNILLEEEANVNKEQMDQYFKDHVRENEDLRRQIADVKAQMDQSFALLRQQNNAKDVSQVNPNESQVLFQQQQLQAASQLLSSMAQLQQQQQQQALAMQQSQGVSIGNGLVSASVLDAQNQALQDEVIQNNALKQRIEQSKLRQMQQIQELERIRNEQNSSQVQQNQQLLNRYLKEMNNNNQGGREKDVLLKQLRTQLAQLQEQRANLRHQCTDLKQKEDDLHSEIFACDQYLKSRPSHDGTESTRLSSVQSEIECVIHKNEGLRNEVKLLEDQLEEKRQVVQKAKTSLRETSQNQNELENALTSQKYHLNKLRFEVEQVRRRMDKEEIVNAVQQSAMQQQQQSAVQDHSSLPATQADGNIAISQFQNQMPQQQQHNQRHQRPDYEIPQYIHSANDGFSAYTGPHSARMVHDHVANYPLGQQQQQNIVKTQSMTYMPRSNQAPHQVPASSYLAFQPADANEMPAAGMPSGMKNIKESQVSLMSPRQAMKPFATHSPQMHQQINHQYLSPNSRAVVNPPPQKPYRPKDNNIFDSPSSEQHEQQRFQTTYTHFANRQKFQTEKVAQQRMQIVPPNQAYLLERLRHEQITQLYPHARQDSDRAIGHRASGVTTEDRRRRQNASTGLMPANADRNIHYEKRYRH